MTIQPAGDVRNTTWLIGKQFNNDGSPIMLKQHIRLDETYTGPAGIQSGSFIYQRCLVAWRPLKMDTATIIFLNTWCPFYKVLSG